MGIQQVMLTQAGTAAATDPYYANVSLLLHCEGANGGVTFTDNSPSPKTPTVFGSAVTSTAQAKFGSSSLYQSTTGDRLVYAADSAFAFGTGDYTMEGFFNMANVSGRVNNVFDTRMPGTTGVAMFVGGGDFSQPPNIVGCSSNTAVLATGGNVSGLTFPHVALCRQSGTIMAFVNGVIAFTVADSRDYGTSSPFTLGADGFGTSAQVALGYIDEVRITKGVARYTANFTPPASPFPDS